MLNMFERPEDPKEFSHLFGIPTAIFMGSAMVGHLSDASGIY
jgi:hypothetical protein